MLAITIITIYGLTIIGNLPYKKTLSIVANTKGLSLDKPVILKLHLLSIVLHYESDYEIIAC